MAVATRNLDWESQMKLAIDPQKALLYREQNPPQEDDACTMCGKFCAIKQVKEYFRD